jgi:hypothetical protein
VAEKAKKIIMVEMNENACEDARVNVEKNNF